MSGDADAHARNSRNSTSPVIDERRREEFRGSENARCAALTDSEISLEIATENIGVLAPATKYRGNDRRVHLWPARDDTLGIRTCREITRFGSATGSRLLVCRLGFSRTWPAFCTPRELWHVRIRERTLRNMLKHSPMARRSILGR